MNLIRTILLGASASLSALTSSASAQVRRLEVEVIRTLGQDQEFGVLLGGSVGPDGAVYIVDMSNSCIWRLDPSTGQVTKIGRAGQGPGEFTRVYRATVRSDGSLLAFDLGTGEVSQFSPEGAFVRRVKLSVGFRQVGSFVSVGNLLALTGSASFAGPISDSAVHIFDDSLRYVRSFGPVPRFADRRKLEYLGTGFVTVNAEGSLFHTHRDAYQIDSYSPTGRRRASLRVAAELKGRVEDGMTLTDAAGRFSVSSNSTGIESPIPALGLPGGRMLGGRLLDRQVAFDLIDDRGTVLASSGFRPSVAILGRGPELGTYWATTLVDDVPVVQLLRIATR